MILFTVLCIWAITGYMIQYCGGLPERLGKWLWLLSCGPIIWGIFIHMFIKEINP